MTLEVGDYVLAINGENVTADHDIYSISSRQSRQHRYFYGKHHEFAARHLVPLRSRPLTSESDLIYLDWIEGNRRRVDQMSNGRVGYLHIPDMGAAGIREFIKWYYPQIRKEGSRR